MMKRTSLKKNGPIGVYRIMTPSGRIYVGMTCDSFPGRWSGHLKKLKNNSHICKGLQNSFNKYGKDNLTYEILEQWEKPATIEELLSLEKDILVREKYWWKYFEEKGFSMLNGCPTGTGSVIHNNEVKEKLSRARKNKILENNPHFCFDKKCKNCQNIYEPKGNELYCSPECKEEYHENYLMAYYPQKITKELLEDFYIEKQLSTTQIAKQLNCSQPTVLNYLKKFNIARRTTGTAHLYVAPSPSL